MQISAGSSLGIRIRVGDEGVLSASAAHTAVLSPKEPSRPFLRNHTGGARAGPSAGGFWATTTLDTATKHTINFVMFVSF